MEKEKSMNLPAESALLVKHFQDRPGHSNSRGKNDEERDFDWVEEGKRQIRECIHSWEIRPCWLYSLDFLCSTEDHDSPLLYHYRARFSTPTPQEPIRGTVSVYFAAAASTLRRDSGPAEAAFVVESSRLVHTPGRSTVREKWLTDVVDDKAALHRRVVDL